MVEVEVEVEGRDGSRSRSMGEVEGRVEASKRVKRLPLLMAIEILNPRRCRWELFPSSISNPIE